MSVGMKIDFVGYCGLEKIHPQEWVVMPSFVLFFDFQNYECVIFSARLVYHLEGVGEHNKVSVKIAGVTNGGIAPLNHG